MTQQLRKKQTEDIKQELTTRTRRFCLSRIDQEYANLCERLVVKLSQMKPAPFTRGKTDIWAAAIIWSIGRLNFLADKSFSPYLELSDLTSHFNTSNSTVGQKAGKILGLIDAQYYDPNFSTIRMLESNPFAKMVMDDKGFIHILD